MASQTRQNYLQVLLESIASVMGILFGAAVLSWRLLKGMRETQRAVYGFDPDVWDNPSAWE